MKKLRHVIRAQQFTKKQLEILFRTAREMEKSPPLTLLAGKIMAALFYEPSTRTRLSFEMAMHRLGGSVISTENAREFSSAAKGESLGDTIRIIAGYGVNIIVLRYIKEGGAEIARRFSTVPIINAGDGPGQHPTQALLDIYTIQQKFGGIKGLNIAMVGDLTNGRTVRSLCYLIAKHYSQNKIYFVSPEQTKMNPDIKLYLGKYNVRWIETDDLYGISPEIDVIYQTRIQKERFRENIDLYRQIEESSKKFAINGKILGRMKDNAIIMHPLPRNLEIASSVDKDPRAVYFEQAQNGLFIRMALLKMILA